MILKRERICCNVKHGLDRKLSASGLSWFCIKHNIRHSIVQKISINQSQLFYVYIYFYLWETLLHRFSNTSSRLITELVQLWQWMKEGNDVVPSWEIAYDDNARRRRFNPMQWMYNEKPLNLDESNKIKIKIIYGLDWDFLVTM